MFALGAFVFPMKPSLILWPALALMAWTFLVLVQVPIRRFHAAFKKRVVAQDFKYGESAAVPADVVVPNRVFMNLLEVSVIFYALVAFNLILGHVDQTVLALAWVYVGLRLVHSLIYLTYNHVIHRFAVFAISNFVVLAMIFNLACWLA